MSTPTISQSTIDLEAARSALAFSPSRLNTILNGNRSVLKNKVSKLVAEDPAFDKSKKSYMSRSQKLAHGLKLTKSLFDLVDRHNLNGDEYLEALAATGESLGINLHEVAFQPVIASQGSDEQQKTWMPLCVNHAIIGCYQQTELGHGSNVQKLETIATYDPKTQTFDLHSPTITSTKWWIGALGLLATHGVVQAKLIIKGKDYGPHLFICQLRSLVDHSLMPNIQAGEIGPKALGGYDHVDNGWARFNHVKIPLNQMLCRFAQVSPEGNYTTPPHAKLAYGGMIYIRARMIGELGWQLAKAVTISTRYLHIRRQFADPELKKGDPGFGVERQVISYPSVYMRILPQIAKACVFITIGKDMSRLFETMSQQLASGNTTLLAETHAVSAGLKSYVSSSIVDGTEVVRRAMGGHGFLDTAGVGRIFATNLPAVTYEGDNFILNLQVARAALKTLSQLRANPATLLSPSSSYLEYLSPAQQSSFLPVLSSNSSPIDWYSHSLLRQLICLRAALQVQRLERLIQGGKSFGELSWECVGVSRSVVEAFLVSRMLFALDDAAGLLNKGVGGEERKVVRDIIHFYSLHTLEQALPDLLEFGIIVSPSPFASPSILAASPVESLRREIETLAQRLVRSSIGIVDGFGFSDFDLDSSLGSFEGRAYEKLLEKAIKDFDLNVGDSEARKKMVEESIRPILERGRRRLEKSKL